jgi:hypothetical protein
LTHRLFLKLQPSTLEIAQNFPEQPTMHSAWNSLAGFARE